MDGDALWRSKKLNEVPIQYRGEYANLIPLADAQGVFDADPYSIWADVYSYNRPNVTVDMVKEMMDSFEYADMIHCWEEDGKRWGTFNGIEKPGRLPTAAVERGDYDIKTPTPPPLWERKVEQKQLNAFKLLPDMCRKLLLIRAEKEEWYKKALKETVEAYGGTRVVEAFEQWASTKPSTKYPIGDFCKVADGYCSGQVIAVDVSGLDDLCTALYDIGNKAFTGKYKQSLGVLLTQYSASDIIKAYKEFISDKDEYELKFVVRDFCEGGAKAIIPTLKVREEKRKQLEQYATTLATEAEARSKRDIERMKVQTEEDKSSMSDLEKELS